jgi:hypothetical protein
MLADQVGRGEDEDLAHHVGVLLRVHRAWVLALRLAREPDRRTREKANMLAATDPPLSGEELLSAVTNSMVALHERYYHRTPVTAKTQMLGDDLLACVLGGGLL